MYLTDPKTGEKSVSLTFLVIVFTLFAGFACAEAFDISKVPSSFSELFYACAALYFGRRVQVGAKSFSAEKEKS